MQVPGTVREMTVDDVAFVVHSWRSNYFKYATLVDASPRNTATMPREHLQSAVRNIEAVLLQPCASRCSRAVYREEQTRLIAATLQRATTRAMVLSWNDGDEDLLFGFVVYERSDKPIIHYLYVKECWRRAGAARMLMDAVAKDVGPAPYWVSHWTHCVPQLSAALGIAIEYNPYRRFSNGVEKGEHRVSARGALREVEERSADGVHYGP